MNSLRETVSAAALKLIDVVLLRLQGFILQGRRFPLEVAASLIDYGMKNESKQEAVAGKIAPLA